VRCGWLWQFLQADLFGSRFKSWFGRVNFDFSKRGDFLSYFSAIYRVIFQGLLWVVFLNQKLKRLQSTSKKGGIRWEGSSKVKKSQQNNNEKQ
jgi:hypothetical protein